MNINKLISEYGSTVEHTFQLNANQLYLVLLQYEKLSAIVSFLQVISLVLLEIIGVWIAYKLGKKYKCKETSSWGVVFFAGVIGSGLVWLFVGLSLIPNIFIFFDPQFGLINTIMSNLGTNN